MFSGGATFFSHKAPHVSTVQRCTYERHTYRYVAYRYSGGMKPAPNSPFTALFDTGHLAIHARSASLVIRKYRR